MPFLINKYKGKYRLLAPYDKITNQFPRKLNGSYEDIDVYIACRNDVKIYYFGHGILEAYIPSKKRGKKIIESIFDENSEDIIYDIHYTDSECYFKFNSKNMDILEKYLCPRTSGAGISPFSSKNLPKTKYEIPESDFTLYKDIVKDVPKNKTLMISQVTNNYLKSLVTSKHTWEDIKLDMSLKGIKGKNYIHSINKWNEYIEYLKANLEV